MTKRFKKMFQMRFMLLLIAGFVMGQSVMAQITASGVVEDEYGDPLTGVSVKVVGSSAGTLTGLDGDFNLSVASGAKLEFSYLGFENKILPATANMSIVLKEQSIELDAIDVQGKRLGIAAGTPGAIVALDADKLRQGVVTSSEQMLQGKVAGLSVVQGSGDPTKGAQLRLRGGSSLSGENSPLVVVDGVAGVDMNTIPSADIVSIDVLKDAASTAIYGSRAANGVIVVTTKRRDKESRSANYSGYFGFAKTANKLEVLDVDQWKENRAPNYDFGGNTDWQDEVMQTAFSQSHALSFSNISQKGGFKGTISYLDSEGVVKTSELQRLGATVSGFTNLLNDHVTIELGLSKSRDTYKDINGADDGGDNQRRFFTTVYQANPTWPIWEVEPDKDGKNGILFRDTNEPLIYNPLNYLLNHTADKTRDRFLGYLKTDIWFFRSKERNKGNEGLKGTINLSYNSTNTQERRYRSILAQDGLQDRPGMRGRADRTLGDYAQQQIEMYLDYTKTFKEIHKLNLMAGYAYVKEKSEGFGTGVRNFDYDDFLYNALGAGKNIYMPEDYDESFETFIPTGAEYSYSYKDQSQIASFFGRVNYTLKGVYIFAATMRADGSSKFGPKHKWGYFPSASFAWRISQERFMESARSKWLDDLKLRVGYGVTGNQGGIASYTSIATYIPAAQKQLEYNTTSDGTVPALVYSPARNANENLKWESTAQFNAGIDFSVLLNRLTGTLEVYNKKTTDLLYFYKVGAIMPVEYTLMNVGELQNAGVELALTGTIIETENFAWTANLNLAHNQNKFLGFVDPRFEDGVVLDMGLVEGPNGPYDGMSNNQYSQKLRPGYSIGSFFGALTDGLDEKGNVIYIKKDGSRTIDPGELTVEDRDNYLGCAMPKLNLGFGMNFNYKHFDLGINTIGAFGQKVYNATAMVLSVPSQKNNVLSSSLGTNTVNCISDYWLEDASFFRIQSITLGYTFNLSEKTKKVLNSLRIYATVENPVVFTNYTGIDPEVSLDMNVTQMDERRKVSPGIDNFNNYPKPRTFLFGLNLQF
jgi:iron complex outermembrane receptor protein